MAKKIHVLIKLWLKLSTWIVIDLFVGHVLMPGYVVFLMDLQLLSRENSMNKNVTEKKNDQSPSWWEFFEVINLQEKKTRNNQPIIMKKNLLASSIKKYLWSFDEMNKWQISQLFNEEKSTKCPKQRTIALLFPLFMILHR
jgi:hypothetical protein